MKKTIIISAHPDGTINAWSTFRHLCDWAGWVYETKRRRPISDHGHIIDGVFVRRIRINEPAAPHNPAQMRINLNTPSKSQS